MAQLGRPANAADISSKIYTNQTRLIKGNTLKGRLLNLNDSSLNIISDLNVNGGYLGIDVNGLVNPSFIRAATPTGKFLKDDGTWDNPVSGSALTSTQVGVGSTLNMLGGTANLTFDPTLSGGNIQRLTIGAIGPQIDMYGTSGGSRIETSGNMVFTLFNAWDFVFRPNWVESLRITSTSKTLIKDSGRTIQLGGWIGQESLYGALYFADTPTSMNYALAGNDTATYLNSTGNVIIQSNNSNQLMIGGGTALFNTHIIANVGSITAGIGAGVSNAWFSLGPSTTSRAQALLYPGLSNASLPSPVDGMLNYDNAGGLNFFSSGIWQRLNFMLPKVRQVWLVADATEQAAMGGTAAGVYITFQSAYDAAMVIVTALNINVAIMVGVTNSVSVGNCTPAAGRWNQNISVIGISSRLSLVGDITFTASSLTLSNAPGTVMFKNVTIGNINGIAGSSAIIAAEDCKFGNLNINTGLLIFRRCFDVEVGNITALASSGLAINTCNNLSLSDVLLTGCSTIQINNYAVVASPSSENAPVYMNSLTATNTAILGVDILSVFIKNNLSITGLNHPTSAYLKAKGLIVGGTTTLNFTAGSGNPLCELVMCRFYGPFTSTNAVAAKFRWFNSFAAKLVNVSANSKFANVSFYDTANSSPIINGIANGCEFYNCTFLGGSLAIDNPTAVSVKFDSGMSAADQPMGANIINT